MIDGSRDTLFSTSVQQKRNEESESKKKRETNLVISHTTSADNSNLSADGDDSFISVEMDSAMPSPFSEVRSLGRGRRRGRRMELRTRKIESINICTV